MIAVNTPMHFRAVPGIDAEDGRAGRLAIRGPNVMAGYYTIDAPGRLQPPPKGWHDSGRAKRFAKLGGEMICLPAVEGYAAACWPGFDHAVVTRPDARKGEQLVLFTTAPDAVVATLSAWAKVNGIPEIGIPRDIRHLVSASTI